MASVSNGPPPLIPIFDVDDEVLTPFRIQQHNSVKSEKPSPVSSRHLTTHQSSQSESPISSNDGSSILKKRLLNVPDKAELPIYNGTTNGSQKSPEPTQLPQSSTSLNGCQSQTRSYSSPPAMTDPLEEEYPVDERVLFLFENPLMLQEIVFRERCQVSSLEIDPDRKIESHFTVVSFQRLRRIYSSGSLHIYLRPNNQLVLVEAVKGQYPVIQESWREITEMTTDWIDVPPVAAELISSLDPVDDAASFVMLLRDTVEQCWELAGVLGSLQPDEPSVENWLNPIVSDDSQDEHLKSDAETAIDVEVTPDLIIGEVKCDETSRNGANNSPVQTAFPIESISCPTFMFSTLAEMISPAHGGLPTPMSSPNLSAGTFRLPLYQQIFSSCLTQEKKEFKCATCSKVLCSKQTLDAHERNHKSSEWKQCGKCGFRAPSVSTINRHVKKHHSDTPL